MGYNVFINCKKIKFLSVFLIKIHNVRDDAHLKCYYNEYNK